MPGIHLIVDLNRDLDDIREQIHEARTESLFSDRYFSRDLLRNRHVYSGFVAYENSPVTTYENDLFRIVVEGKVYNQEDSALKKNLFQVAETVFLGRGDPIRTIKAWLMGADGDFVILFQEKSTGRLIVLNDALSRLPLYYHLTGNRLILSRDMTFLQPFVHGTSVDRTAIAEYLLFGYPLGSKTLLADVLRLPPATCIRVNPQEKQIRFHSIHLFDFSGKENRGKTTKENARSLARLFTEALVNRVETMKDCKSVVSLSGGLDSRAVAAGLAKSRVAFSSISFLDDEGNAEPDVRIAACVARLLNTEWRSFDLGPASADDYRMLLKAKHGLNTSE